ncbi:MAG TPA: ATP-binding protein [Rhizobacter sp.]|nr:ATP-binding protein [Rhizobacter sp.]
MSLARPSPLRDWAWAAMVGVLAVALRGIAEPLLGDRLPFVVAFPLTVLASVMWGTGPGLLTALLCAVAAALPSLPPNIDHTDRPIEVGSFLLASIVIALLCGQFGRAHSQDSEGTPGQEIETPLTAWLRAVLWGAFLVPTTAFVMTAWWGFERAQRDAELAAAHACDLVYEHARRTLSTAADIARRADSISAAPDVVARHRELEIHQRLSDMTVSQPSILNLNVWDAEGRPIARSDIFPVDPAASVADRAYFQEQRAANLPLGVSEVLKGRQTGLELFNATMRRTSADGSFRGVVAVSMKPEFFRDYYRSLSTEAPHLGVFALIRLDGEIIARWPPTTDGRTRVPANSPVLARIAEGVYAGNITLPSIDGAVTRIVSFKRVEGYPLFVTAGFGREGMLAGWIRFVGLLAAILVPTTAGLVYVSWVALKKTRREQAAMLQLQEQSRRRAKAEKSMLEAQKLETLAVVTGGVAHDFNNLLAIVNTSLHVLKRLHPELAEQKQVKAMSRAIQTGVRLTRQLLSFSRKQALRPEVVSLQSWLPATEGLIKVTLPPGVSWQLTVEPDTAPIEVDVGELELALINLVVNAGHAMPQGGTLRIHAGNLPAGGPADAPRRVGIAVTDSGVGIPAHLLAKVMEPFFTTRDKGAGSGLGLSQVQGFCAQAGGSVEIDSEVGRGTTVRMQLPASQRTVAGAEAEEEPMAGKLSGRILLVEDNDELASTTEIMLRTAGLEVLRVASADAALAYLANASALPDAVLSDIAMPGSINGIGLAFELRRRMPGLPVLLTTGYAEQLDEATEGGFRVLPKPTSPEQLLAELRAVLPARPRPQPGREAPLGQAS